MQMVYARMLATGKLCGVECKCCGCFSDGHHMDELEEAWAKYQLKNPEVRETSEDSTGRQVVSFELYNLIDLRGLGVAIL